MGARVLVGARDDLGRARGHDHRRRDGLPPKLSCRPSPSRATSRTRTRFAWAASTASVAALRPRRAHRRSLRDERRPASVPVPVVARLQQVDPSLRGQPYIGPHWRFDAVLAHVFADGVTVAPTRRRSRASTRCPGNAPLEPVNGGTYAATANIVGVGLNYKF